MDKYEHLILRWVCLFDNFQGEKYTNITSLISSKLFKEFVNDVFCFKYSSPSNTEDENLYKTIKGNYHEFEVPNHEDLYNGKNSVYTCIVVLLHALLKCTDNKFRDQLSEKMNDEEQVLLAKFLASTQSALFTIQNISEALLTIDPKNRNENISEVFSNNTTPIKTNSMRRSYLQEFCESPKSQSLICQEKEKLIAKLNEEYKNECEENYKLAENIKILQDMNTKLSNRLEDKDKIIKCLKDEIEEFTKPKELSNGLEVKNALTIKKLNQDILDLEMNNKELKLQIAEVEIKHQDLNSKFEKTTFDHENLLLTFDQIVAENISLKENIVSVKETLQKKNVEIISLKDELLNKSVSNNVMDSNHPEDVVVPSNTLFDELSCIKLEEVTHDKEKYRHKYKSIKKELSNVEKHVKNLDEENSTLKQKLHDCEVDKKDIINKFSNKKIELQECRKKNSNLETKIKHLKDAIKDKENHNKDLCSDLVKKEHQIKELCEEMDSVKKAKLMIELILSKTNAEIEALHEENNKHITNLKSKIENFQNSEELSQKNIVELDNKIKQMQGDIANKESIIIFYEEKMAENYQAFNNQEEQLKTMYHEKLMLESHLKDMKTEIETQQKMFNNKNREMETCLEYHFDELKDAKNNVIKMEEILSCKQNEIDRQFELINYQKNIIETLKSEKYEQEININGLNDVLQQKTTQINELQVKLQESTLNIKKLEDQLNSALNEKIELESNLKINDTKMKTSIEEFHDQINDMKNLLKTRNDEIIQFKSDLEKLKNAFDKKQNDFNKQLIISNKQIEKVSQLRLEKYDLEEKLKSSAQTLLDKTNEIKCFEEKLNQNELKIKHLSKELTMNNSKNNSLIKNLNMVTSTVKHVINNYDEKLMRVQNNLKTYNDKIYLLTNKLFELKNYLCVKINELDTQISLNDKQKEDITLLETEKHVLEEKIKIFDQYLLDKDIKITNLEKELQSSVSNLKCVEEQLGVMSIEKVIIETNLNESTEQFKNSQEHFTEQINNLLIKLNNRDKEVVELKSQSLKLENILETKQIEIENQLKLTFEQCETVKNIKSEKDILEKQILHYNECSNIMQSEIKSLKEEFNVQKSSVLKLEKELDAITKEKMSLETSLKNSIHEKEIINQKLNDEIEEMKNCLKSYVNENNDIKNNLAESKSCVEQKQLQFEQASVEIANLKECIKYTENHCVTLQDKLKELNDSLVKKDNDINSLEKQNSEHSVTNEMLEKQLVDVRKTLNDRHIELEKQIQYCNEQREMIVKINCEKETFCDKIKNLESALLHKEYEFNLSEGKLYDSSVSINNLEEKLKKLNDEKSSLELKLNETFEQLTKISENLTQQLEDKEQNILGIKELLSQKQNELEEQIRLSNEQKETISILNREKNTLLVENNNIKTCLNDKDNNLQLLEEEKHNYSKKYEELHNLKLLLESEIKKNKMQLANINQESKQKLEDIEAKFIEAQKQLNEKNIEINEYICKSNEHLETIATLMSEKDNLINETNALTNTVLSKESIIASNQENMVQYEKHNDELKSQNVVLEIELIETKKQLDNTHCDLTQKLEETVKKLSHLQEQLHHVHVDLETRIKETDEQNKVIFALNSEKESLLNEIGALKDCSLEKENALVLKHKKLVHIETQLEELKSQKMFLESELNETKTQYENIEHELNHKLGITETKLHGMQKQLDKGKSDLEEQNKVIKVLTCEKNNLLEETNRLKECLAQNECVLASYQDKIQYFDEYTKEVESQKDNLILELNQLKSQLVDMHQESTEQIVEKENKLFAVQEQLNDKQYEIKKQIEIKNNSLEDIYQKISDLKNIKNELEFIMKKERENFETCLESYSNYSINYIKSEPIFNDHQDSLMEVITSADTFIEQNGIQLVQIDNCDEYSIIERLKKLFEALKMFIININTQGTERAIAHADNKCFNEEYADLLAKSNSQIETIKHLESEMSRLKTECNYKMSKVQQKTQEYVTSEYEKKFERKREQMKQFCKDLETKIHQDYETKLIKYKEKINKDEIHIKELGQQLWEVSEKFLKLQQKDRRESTMSLPFEMTINSQNTFALPQYSSYTLPKSSSAGQIRSLIEESTRSNHGSRNVPAGIGKKFSLSSGKIFPKEEDEEGEMFNHSCLADLKQGRVRLNDINGKQFNERLSELQARNSLCPPHLRSCYAVETNYLPNASLITEEDIKTSANYSDCESENLIPNDRKKKERNQTSYKKPGPPTPSKNGGRVSLSGNAKIALKEPKDSNANKRRTSSTPNKLFSLFMSKK